MVLAVYVQQQRESMLPDHVVQRLADPAVVAVPGRERAARLRRRGRVAAAVSVELGAVQLAGDQVRHRSKPPPKLRADRAGQLQRARVLADAALGALRNVGRRLRATVRRREHDGHGGRVAAGVPVGQPGAAHGRGEDLCARGAGQLVARLPPSATAPSAASSGGAGGGPFGSARAADDEDDSELHCS
jgi:hypothetical protein